MKNRVWINLVMVAFVSGLFLTVSCSNKTIVPDPTPIQDQETLEADARAQADADRMTQMSIDEKRAKENAMKEAIAKAKEDFINQDVLFAYDSIDLDESAIMILKEKAAWLMANTNNRITIQGHCDERGTTEYNLALGERRASVVKAYLVNLGISASRLNTISYGEESPISMAKTEAAYRLNRRAHFVID